jgi:hypothetical protein
MLLYNAMFLVSRNKKKYTRERLAMTEKFKEITVMNSHKVG